MAKPKTEAASTPLKFKPTSPAAAREKKPIITTPMDQDLFEQVQTSAEASGVSMANFVRQALKFAMDNS